MLNFANKKKIIVGCFLFICLLSVGLSFQQGVSYLLSIEADYLLNDHRFVQDQALTEKVISALDKIDYAIQINPSVPEFHEWKGRLLLLHANLTSVEERYVIWEDAVMSLREAIRLKPAWPWNYLYLANAKYFMGQIDDEFYWSYQMAGTLGKNEIHIHKALAKIGLTLWRPWRTEFRPLIKQHFIAVRAFNTTEAFLMAKEAGLINLTCLWIRREPDQFGCTWKKRPW